jgi:hypothetical protein
VLCDTSQSVKIPPTSLCKRTRQLSPGS